MKKLFLQTCVLLSFFLAPPAAADTPWRFIVVGDTQGSNNGINGKIVRELVQAVIKEAPACVIVPGDLVSGGTRGAVLENQLRAWRREFMEPLKENNIAVYPVRGDHETAEDGNDLLAWDKVFSGIYALPANGPRGETKTTYSFTVNNAFFAGLDMYRRGREHTISLPWLEKQLKENRLPHVFLFAHEPVYALAGRDPDRKGPEQFQADRDRFVRMAVSYGGVSYFCGHDHWYDHAKIEIMPGKWFHQFVAGTGGGPAGRWMKVYRERGVTGIAHAENYGYLLAEIDGATATLTMKTRSPDGTYLPANTFTYTVLSSSSTLPEH